MTDTSNEAGDNALTATSIHRNAAKVAALVQGDKRDAYGEASASFARIAALWSALLGRTISAQQVAAMMMLLKLSRLEGSNYTHEDSWVDATAYALLGWGLTPIADTE